MNKDINKYIGYALLYGVSSSQFYSPFLRTKISLRYWNLNNINISLMYEIESLSFYKEEQVYNE